MLLEDQYFKRVCNSVCKAISFVMHPTEPTTKIPSRVYSDAADIDGSEGWCPPRR